MRSIMILYRQGAVILLQLLAMSVVVNSNVCLLRKRPDPSLGGTLSWSLLFKELCNCQAVLAPRSISRTCPIKDESCPDGYACNLWFVDDPTQLTQRQNWNADKLDVLLERAIYCKEATKAETEGASSSQKTGAIEASTFADQDEITQVETEGASSSQRTDAVETSTSVDQEETTQAETEGESSSQRTDAIKASTSADQDETTQAETEGASSSQRTDAVETSTSVDQDKTTHAEAGGGSSSQRIDAIKASTSADQEETTQAETAGAISSQKTDAVEASTSADQEETTQAETEGGSSSQRTDATKASTSADQEGTTQAETADATSNQKTDAVEASTSADQECESFPLGMASGAIQDSYITASSFHTASDWDREPKYARPRARFGSDKFWSADSRIDLAPWIRVFLGSSFLVTGLQTESGLGITTWYWVKTITVKTGTSDQSLKFIEDDDAVPKVFNASFSGPNEVANVTLNSNGIQAQFVEIHPTSCWQKRLGARQEKSPFCVLRFEILGCSKL